MFTVYLLQIWRKTSRFSSIFISANEDEPRHSTPREAEWARRAQVNLAIG